MPTHDVAMKLFFSVGEPSGDVHGANLIHALRLLDPSVKCVGYGGPKMAAAGCQVHKDLTQFAVMWFLRVLTNLHTFWQLVTQADRYFRYEKPDAVILIDYPGFNWWIARRAKAHGIPVFYYGAPQMWAWAPWRVHKMQRLVNHVLCKLPFEAEWYQARRCNATYVGHPFFDETQSHDYDEKYLELLAAADGPLVTILPGSRSQEVKANLQAFVRTAEKVHHRFPTARFSIAAFNDKQAQFARELCRSCPLSIEVSVGHTPELIRSATVCLACSGSVSLELLYHQKPTVIHYQVSSLAMLVQKFFRHVRYITLVNLLASKHPFYRRDIARDLHNDPVPFPEFLTSDDCSDEMANHLCRWLEDDASRQQVIHQLAELSKDFAEPGTSQRAALYIRKHLPTPSSKRRTHYQSHRAA